MARAQKPDFVFRRNGRVHLNRRGRQFSRLLAAEVCASAVIMLDTPCSEVVWRVLATHSIRQFPLHFPSRASPCAITFQLESAACTLSYPHHTTPFSLHSAVAQNTDPNVSFGTLFSHTSNLSSSAYEATCLGKSEINTFYYLGSLVAFGR